MSSREAGFNHHLVKPVELEQLEKNYWRVGHFMNHATASVSAMTRFPTYGVNTPGDFHVDHRPRLVTCVERDA